MYRLSRASGLAPMTSLLLTGYAVGSLLAAGPGHGDVPVGRATCARSSSTCWAASPASSWQQLAVARCRSSCVASALILRRARSLNGFLLGEDAAAHLGVDVRRERAILLGLGVAGHRRGRRASRA